MLYKKAKDSEGELSGWAKNRLKRARKTSESEYVSLKSVKKAFCLKKIKMPYLVRLDKKAEKFIGVLPKNITERTVTKLDSIKEKPF